MDNVINGQHEHKTSNLSIKAVIGIELAWMIGTVTVRDMMLLLLVLMFPLSLLGLIATFFVWMMSLGSKQMRAIRKQCWQMMVVMSIALIIVPAVGFSQRAADIAEAKTFCQMLITRLEAEKKQQGAYPDDITPFVQELKNVPRFIRLRRLYHTYQGEYTLSFSEPAGMFPVDHTYRSVTGMWEAD